MAAVGQPGEEAATKYTIVATNFTTSTLKIQYA
jgi:hypothetical protein